MKRITITLPSLPVLIGLVFALLLGMALSTFTASPASGATPAAAISGPVTACVGNSSPNGVKLDLGGRVITPSTILKLDPTGACAGESSITWNPSSDINYVKVTATLAGLNAQEFRAYCPAGKQATSGGFIVNLADVNLGSNIRVLTSAPYSNNFGNYWSAVIENFNDPAAANTTANITVYAVCQTLAPGVVPAALNSANPPTPDLYNNPVKLGN
ncbi:MAG TPA: hypothetical protein VH186_01270 [Chloroflexia bacterium]|nr:hypothetical protein [Chloroflexia bacterium]